MKKIILSMIAAVAAISVMAAPVDPATAMRKAQTYLKQMYQGKMMSPAAMNPVLLKAEMGDSKLNKPVYYIYNTSTTFLVIAGDDRAEEILMVGDAPLKDINNLPLGMHDMLSIYKEEIDYLHAHPGLVVKSIPSPRNTPQLKAVTINPLLTAIWDQNAPFWNQCKFSYNNTTYQCYTGCPATSASMVLYFWKYPLTVDAIPSYSASLELSYYNSVSYTYPALPATAFDWPNMKDSYTGSYTTAQGNAVATLMRYVGQAEGMMYGTAAAGGSGIYVSENSRIADMFKLFGYKSTARNVQKSSYGESNWAALIQSELIAGRPLVYCAVSSSEGGHAFNVDGYRDSDNKYHVNWGWSGDGNSWFAMNSFSDGSGTFNQSQQAIVGVEPPDVPSTAPELSVEPTSLSFTGAVGQTYTQTFTVRGTDIVADVSLSSSVNIFNVTPSTLTAAQANAGATVTVTYTPTAAGTRVGTITVSSLGAEDKTVSVTGTATSIPTLAVNPNALNFNTTLNTPVTQTFTVTGANLSGAVYLSCAGQGFSIDKTNIGKNAATNGAVITVTYRPTTMGVHTGTVTLTSTGAEAVTVNLNGQVNIEKYLPVMLPVNEEFINLTQFRADWTDETPAENIASYTLEVSAKADEPEPEPDPVLIGSLSGTSFSGSGYYAVTLTAPWAGTNVRGHNNEILYFRNNYNSDGSYGNITYTVPAGYENTTFTMKITTGTSTTEALGNLTVATPQTAGVTHYFNPRETYAWVVTASSGDKITITTPDAQYSPDIALIEVYSGNATEATLKANESGDALYRLITGITDKYYTVNNLAAEGTFLYKVKAIYVDGTESDWSNIEEVTLFQNGHGYELGDVNHSGDVTIADVTALIDALLSDASSICEICADVNESGDISIADVTALIDKLLGGNTTNMVRKTNSRHMNSGK